MVKFDDCGEVEVDEAHVDDDDESSIDVEEFWQLLLLIIALLLILLLLFEFEQVKWLFLIALLISIWASLAAPYDRLIVDGISQ